VDGNSEIARAFGANVNMTWETNGLYLVKGRAGSPASLVRSSGGKVAVEMGAGTVLAALPFASYLAFREHAEVAFIGPVSVDPQRFEQFLRMMSHGAPR